MSDWKDEAACKGLTVLFFAERFDREAISKARALCASCPVRVDCLNEGMLENHGVWGGTSERQRRVLRREVEWTRPCADCSTAVTGRGYRPLLLCDDCRRERRRQSTRRWRSG